MKKIITLGLSVIVYALTFGQAQRLVLFEEFTGENCPPCAAYNPYLDQLAEQYAGDVVLLHYLSPIPTAGTLYYQDATDANGRLNYYGVNSTPWGQQDGWMWDSTLLASDGNNPITWAQNSNYLTNEYAVPSPFTIDIQDTFTSGTDSFYATVNVTAAENFTASGTLKLQFAMVENLQFAYPPGNNGETAWGNAVRKMYPGSGGTTVPSSWTNGEVKTYHFSGKVPSYIYDVTQVRFVAFVQNTGTKFVEQTGISNFFTFNLDLATTGIVGHFDNCNASQYTPVLSLSNLGNQNISSCYINTYVDGVFQDSTLWTGNLPGGNSLNTTLNSLTLAPGLHTLKVVLTSPNFTTDPNQGNNTATITFNVSAPTSATPLTEGFENGDPIANDGWAVEDLDHDSTWRVVATGHNSSHSEMVDFIDDFANDFVSPSNNLYAPPLNLTYTAHATVKFDYANQFINFGNNEYGGDSLYIDVSSDCGNTWTTVYGKGNSTAPAQNYGNTLTNFVPTSTQWASDSADISVVSNHDNVLLRFRPTFDDGNNFYLDNVNIYTYDSVPYTPPTGIASVYGIQSLQVYPNPANSQVNVVVTLDKDLELGYQLTDVTGNQIIAATAVSKMAGENIFTINTATLTNGIYFVTMVSGANKVSKMIAVVH
jgi:thiol-disulfide isomerase/thioredoxin